MKLFKRLIDVSDPVKVVASLTVLVAFVAAAVACSLLSVSCEVIWTPTSTTLRPAPEAIDAAIKELHRDK